MRPRFDIWATERSSAIVLDHGLRVHVTDTPPIAKIWHPKGTKPAAFYRFPTVERRDAYVDQYIKGFSESIAAKQARRTERRELATQHSNDIGVGHIFRWSWGYDQTNIDYFQVIAKNGQNVTVREIAQSTVPGSEYGMSERVKPRLGRFLEGKKPFTKRLQFTAKGEAYLSMDFGWCGLWRGEASYQSHYA